MSQHLGTTFTGPITIPVSSMICSPAGQLELAVSWDIVEVRHLGRMLAVLDRDVWRSWLRLPDDDDHELSVDDVRWTRDDDIVNCWSGRTGLRLAPDDVEYLREVI